MQEGPHNRKRDLKVHHGTLNGVGLEEEAYDVAVLLDVIEHIAGPDRTARTLHRILRPGSLVLITTGDWRSRLARVMGRHWRLMTPPQHLYFFSLPTLSRLFDSAGFEVVCFDRPWKHVPLGRALFQATRRIGLRVPFQEAINTVGVPLNLFDTVRLAVRKK